MDYCSFRLAWRRGNFSQNSTSIFLPPQCANAAPELYGKDTIRLGTLQRTQPEWTGNEIVTFRDFHFRGTGGYSVCVYHACTLDPATEKDVKDMPQGRQTCSEIQWAIVRLSRMLDQEQVSAGLNLSTRTVQRVLAHFHKYGTVPNEDDQPAKRDRSNNRHLRDIDVEVWHGYQSTVL